MSFSDAGDQVIWAAMHTELAELSDADTANALMSHVEIEMPFSQPDAVMAAISEVFYGITVPRSSAPFSSAQRTLGSAIGSDSICARGIAAARRTSAL